MPSFDLFRKQKNQDNPSAVATSVVGKQMVKDVQESVSGSVQNGEVPRANVVVQDDDVVDGSVSDGDADGLPVVDSPFDVEGLREFAMDKMMYLKAMPLRDTLDLEGIKAEVEDGNILILRITPLASKSIEAVKSAVNELYIFAESIGGDIARLGEERVVICPRKVRIWREKVSV
ncbi:MAG: cell division protein SepF [Candidatus Bathyarchaeota archaeon]|nr:cell division protein SepF [Candidatus Termiticorpusculum sp.]